MVIAIVLAGGRGMRLTSDIPKQYIEVEGKPVISYCLETILNMRAIDYVRIVAAKEWHSVIENSIKNEQKEKLLGFTAPGDSRQLSIWNALEDLKDFVRDKKNIIVIHDAARPLVSDRLLLKGIRTTMEHEGALPVLPMKDTVYYTEDGVAVSSLLDRQKVVAGQAPEFFDYKLYYDANASLVKNSRIYEINGSTEPAVIVGMDIALIVGEEENFKITTNADLERFRQIMRARKE